ncbi:uncharacterized protein [Amphiura filiformis]|uniref:uncharacterized protein n=1 Tax=Amphiura filiformis TaxID=82378 RepID=UPI003B211E4A
MGSTCSMCRVNKIEHGTVVEKDGVARWLGHTLYGNGLDDSDSSIDEASPTRLRISEEVRAQYTNYQPTVITILHFNDVYNIEERKQEPVGGAARFATVIKRFQHENPLVFFSGDALNPSIMSSVTRGQQMLPVLNAMKINTAVFGNHDFDFGVDELQDFTRESNYPWMLSNVIDNFTGEPLADGLVTRMITYKGKKIGLIGLVEEEWLVTLTTIDRENLTYIDYVEQGRKLAKELKQQGADFVIALTHMRMPNDIRLAENVEDIDLILGGHDHDYDIQQVNGHFIVKSGTDFRTLSKLNIEVGCYGNHVEIDKLEVTSEVEEDPHVRDIVEQFKEKVSKEMEGTLGYIEVDLEARFSIIRTQETNLGNFVTDIMLSTTKADVALLNSGTFRTDAIISAGEFKRRDLMTMLPFIDSLMVLQITGEQLLECLENGVSQHPKKEGRFPQVSGIQFGYHPSTIPGHRVDPFTILVDSQHILPRKLYRICTKQYLAEGKDGYEVFRRCPILVDQEEGPILSTIVQNHFTAVEMVKGLKPCRSGHRQSLISLTKRHSFLDQAEISQAEQAQSNIAPSVEGRIFHLDDKDVCDLQRHRERFLSATDEELIEEMQCWEENNNYVEKRIIKKQKDGHYHHDICTIPEATVSSPDLKLHKTPIAVPSASTGFIAGASERTTFSPNEMTSEISCHEMYERSANVTPLASVDFVRDQKRSVSPDDVPSKSNDQLSDSDVTTFRSSSMTQYRSPFPGDAIALACHKQRSEGEVTLTQDRTSSPDNEIMKTTQDRTSCPREGTSLSCQGQMSEGEVTLTQGKAPTNTEIMKTIQDRTSCPHDATSFACQEQRSEGVVTLNEERTSPDNEIMKTTQDRTSCPCDTPSLLCQEQRSEGEVTLPADMTSSPDNEIMKTIQDRTSCRYDAISLACQEQGSEGEVTLTADRTSSLNNKIMKTTQDRTSCHYDAICQEQRSEGDVTLTEDNALSTDNELLNTTSSDLDENDAMFSRCDDHGTVPFQTCSHAATLIHNCSKSGVAHSTLSSAIPESSINEILIDSISKENTNAAAKSCCSPSFDRTHTQDLNQKSNINIKNQTDIKFTTSGEMISCDIEGNQNSSRRPLFQQDVTLDKSHAAGTYTEVHNAIHTEMKGTTPDKCETGNERRILDSGIDPVCVSIHGLQQDGDKEI